MTQQLLLQVHFSLLVAVDLHAFTHLLNEEAKKGFRLHSFSTVSSGSKGLLGGDRIQVTAVFEKIE